MKYICKKSSNQEMFAISLSSCSRYNANFKLDQSVLAIHDSPLYLRSVRMTTHRNIVGEPRPRSLMNFRLRYAFVSPGVNSRAELVPSHGASRRRLGDDQLRWDEQIDNISNKVSQGIGILRRANQFVKRETLQFLCNSIYTVQPYFENCSLVWGNCGESLKEKLQKLQNRAGRVIVGDTYDIRSKDI
jgi:hypothetical protein